MRRKSKFFTLIITSLLAMSMTACDLTGDGSKAVEPIKDNTPIGVTTDQTATTGIDSSSADFESKLENNTYYVVHDGIYYPLYSSYTSETLEDTKPEDLNSPDDARMRFYTLEDETEIPTLFPGDQLIFYSQEKLTDIIHWERYYDMGVTFGIRELKKTEGGRYYLDFSNDDVTTVFDRSELYEMYTLGVDEVLIDKIGDVQVTDSMVENGIIVGASKNQTYDMEVYTGTIYKHYNAVANFHAFRSYEVYASLDYTTLRDNFFEIEIPSCFTTGYYDIDNTGMFRLCKDYSYSPNTDYNVQILYPALEGRIQTGSGEEDFLSYERTEIYTVADYEEFMSYKDHPEIRTSCYSENEEINNFATNVVGTPGFVDPNEAEEEFGDPFIKKEQVTMAVAKQIQYDLWFPEGKNCEIQINTDEGTGEAYIVFANGSVNALAFNKLDKRYETSLAGQGIRGRIVIGGLTKGYEILLKNAVIYENQDGLNGSDIE